MNLEAKKIELAKLILSIENESVFEKLLEFIKGTKVSALSKEELEIIDLGLNLSAKGQRISFKDYLKKVS